MNATIPPKKNRTVQRPYDENLYKLRHLVKNAFLYLECWRSSEQQTSFSQLSLLRRTAP